MEQSLKASLVPKRPTRQSVQRAADDIFLREVAFIACEAAFTTDTRVRTLGAQLLAMSAPRLAALGDGGAQ